MAATNKYLAQSNNSGTGGKATKKRRSLPAARRPSAAGLTAGRRWGRHHTPAIIQGSRMRIKFGTVDKNGKLHKRASVSRFYSHCVVIHFAALPPSKFWPKGVTAYSCAEWAGSLALAEGSASRWRKEPDVEAIEILEARQV